MVPKSLLAFAAAGLAAIFSATSFAQTYPAKPVRLVVTYPPGGSSDLMGRVLGQKLSEIWGQQVIIESKPGAAGSIGMEFAARQPADGYTFVIGNLGPTAVNPLLSKVPYDIQRDFVPVSMVCTGPNILVVNSNSPIRTLHELIDHARAKPGTLNFGTGGAGSVAHLGGELMKRLASVDIVHVPYKGGVLSVQDLLGGQVQMVFSDALPVMQHIRAGKLRPLAVTSPQRSALTPEIPTFVEQGVNLVAINWWGVLMPTGTPKPIVERMNRDLVNALATDFVKQKFAELGVEAVSSTPEQFRDHILAESAKYAKLIKEAGIRVD